MRMAVNDLLLVNNWTNTGQKVWSTMDPRELLLMKLLQFARTIRADRLLRFRASTYHFADYFKGFEKVEAVRHLFGDKTEEVLRNIRVEFTFLPGYMWVSGSDGHITVSSRYLHEGDKIDIYLDVIHELTHVKQFMEGKELFDVHYGYVDRPTEIEAYRLAIVEARRLGLSEERICDYLKTEWMSMEDLKQLAVNLGVRCYS